MGDNRHWIVNSGVVFEDIACITITSSIGKDYFFDDVFFEQEELQQLESQLSNIKENSTISGTYGKRRIYVTEIIAYDIEYK